MKNLDGILNLIDREFGEMIQNGKFRNRDDVEISYKLIDVAKDIYEIWDYESKMQSGYSESYPMNSGVINPYGSITYGHNYNAPRNGHGYSRGGAKEEYIENLRRYMMDAPDDRTRDCLQRMLNELENY